MSTSESKLATAKTILTTVGSIAATAVVVRGVAHDLLPPEFHDYIFSAVRTLFSAFSNTLTMVIDEFDGLDSNEIYQAAETYLGPMAAPSARRLKISRPEKEKHLNITMEKDQHIVDTFDGQKFTWVWVCTKSDIKNFYNPRDMNSTLKSEVRSFELTFHRKNKEMVINAYLPHIANVAKTKKHEKKTIKIFTIDPDNLYNVNDMWIPVTFDHPATFDTLAMDDDQKRTVLKDLEKFVGRKEYYRKVGKAWKRGYLLYGPPGTGKSSLIAAMANYLNFDVYDLELSEVRRNSELRRLLVGMGNKSILVVEDIDCSIDLQEKLENRDTAASHTHGKEESKVTLSGLLNFVDGLWSSCGDERIIIFTTNHVKKLDPALLRPGRMDVHINLSYCTPCGLRLLALNYLGIKEHASFVEIEELLPTAKATPAEVAEELLKSSDDDPDVGLQGLIDFLHKKMKENNEEIIEKAEFSDCKKEIVEIKENGETNLKVDFIN